MPVEISKFDDVIDSRDVIARLEALEAEKELQNDSDGLWSDGDEAELAALRAFASEASGHCPDWLHGEALIRDSYFKHYAQELAEDCGMIKADAVWPNNYIDWDSAAAALQMDYSSAEFDGVVYWFR